MRFFCELSRSFIFNSIDSIDDTTTIKTFSSYNKSKDSFISLWFSAKPEYFDNGTYEIVEVVESISKKG